MTTPPSSDAHRGWHSRGYLPHFNQAGLVQMITFRLHDSLPGEVWRRLRLQYPEVADPRRNSGVDAYLDAGHGRCWLRDSRLAKAVEDRLLHYDSVQYHLLAYVVMPNHVHAIVQQEEGFELGRIVQAWKSASAHATNRLLSRRGRVWQPDYFDRMIRDERHLHDATQYVHRNPVKAGLVARAEDWQYSSASHHGPS